MSLRLSLGQAWRASRHLCASRPLRSVCGPFAGFNEVATRWNSGGPELDSDQALPSLFKLSSAVVQPKQKLVVPDIDDGVSPTPSEPLPKDALQTELRLNSPPLSDSKPDMVQPQLIFDAAWRKLVHKFGTHYAVWVWPAFR